MQQDIERQRAQLQGLDHDLEQLNKELAIKNEECATLRAQRNEALLMFMCVFVLPPTVCKGPISDGTTQEATCN